MRGMQFLAYLFNFIPLLQREMYIALLVFLALVWYRQLYWTGLFSAVRIFMRFANFVHAIWRAIFSN
jgi:hypothetical protein